MSFTSNFVKLKDYISDKIAQVSNTASDTLSPPIFWVRLNDEKELEGGMSPVAALDNPHAEARLVRHSIKAGAGKGGAVTISGTLENILFYLVVYVRDFECNSGIFYANLKPVFDTHNMTWSAVNTIIGYIPGLSTLYGHAKKVYSAGAFIKGQVDTRIFNADKDPVERLRYAISKTLKSQYNSAVVWELKIWGNTYSGEKCNIILDIDGRKLSSFVLSKIVYYKFMDVFCLAKKLNEVKFMSNSFYSYVTKKQNVQIELQDFSQKTDSVSVRKPKASGVPLPSKKKQTSGEVELQDLGQTRATPSKATAKPGTSAAQPVYVRSWDGPKPMIESFNSYELDDLVDNENRNWKLFKINHVRGVGYLDDAPIIKFCQTQAKRFDKANQAFFRDAFKDKTIIKTEHEQKFLQAKDEIWATPKFDAA